jgi:3'(2'), 5'-bisphosphate nucleotidase
VTDDRPTRADGASAADHQLAAELAEAAGRLLLEVRAGLDGDGVDADAAAAVRAAGDRRSNDLLLAALAEAAPDDAVLSEEAVDDRARLGSSRVWIVDPLDGTREFGEAGRVDWAVHVALAIDGAPVAGAVALPATGEVLATSPAPVLATSHEGPIRLVVSRTRPPAAATFLAERLDAALVTMGSAGAKAMSVIRGESDVYVHSGGQYEWDSCAPVAVALAAGCHCSRIDGSPLTYNAANPYLPDLLICRPELAERALEALRSFEA